MSFPQFLGWLGNIMLSVGIFPQVYQTWKTGDTSSFNWPFLLLWAFGVLFTLVYIIDGDLKSGRRQYPLWINYFVNIAGTFYLCYAKLLYG